MSHQVCPAVSAALGQIAALLQGIKSVQERRVLTEKTKADRLTEQAEKAVQAEERLSTDETLLDLLDASLQRRSSD
jgi:hypothetical protein